jgi:hypothetical protein
MSHINNTTINSNTCDVRVSYVFGRGLVSRSRAAETLTTNPPTFPIPARQQQTLITQQHTLTLANTCGVLLFGWCRNRGRITTTTNNNSNTFAYSTVSTCGPLKVASCANCHTLCSAARCLAIDVAPLQRLPHLHIQMRRLMLWLCPYYCHLVSAGTK